MACACGFFLCCHASVSCPGEKRATFLLHPSLHYSQEGDFIFFFFLRFPVLMLIDMHFLICKGFWCLLQLTHYTTQTACFFFVCEILSVSNPSSVSIVSFEWISSYRGEQALNVIKKDFYLSHEARW